MSKNNSFVLFTENRDVFDGLPDKDCAALIRAIFQYEDDGTIAELDGAAKYVFLMIKKELDRNSEKYEKVKAARSNAGKKSAEARAKSNKSEQKTTNVNKQEQTSANSTVNDNDNVNEKEKINKKESESEKEFEQLWELYPKKQGKADARKHYLKAKKDGATFDEVKEGIEAYADYIQKTGTDFQYIKMGSSFFCQRGWESTWDAPEGRASPEEGEVWHSSLSEEEFNRLCEMHEGPDPW